tara:strand:+ start:1416 stop:1661 length:246 start_codon:yes stop_codon:yes gene_type:complete
MTTDTLNLQWTHTPRDRHLAELDGAIIKIFPWRRGWDVGITVNGQGYDRIFGGQPVHDSPSLAKEWVLDNITKIRGVVASN